VQAAELSTASDFLGNEGELHAASRQNARVYKVNTVTLNDMLRDCHAPAEIDYLSIDTEGSEYKILSGFNFELCRIRVITVEHNYGSDRERIYDLLTANGFRRKFQVFSRWDDWYVAT
jgi:FkbM family methyltransferase